MAGSYNLEIVLIDNLSQVILFDISQFGIFLKNKYIMHKFVYIWSYCEPSLALLYKINTNKKQ